MYLSSVLFELQRFFVIPTVVSVLYIYLYPAIHECSFPDAKPAEAACYQTGQKGVPRELAPFRLLTFGDPQLEGDTSLPNPDAPWFPSLSRVPGKLQSLALQDAPIFLGQSLLDSVKKDIPAILHGLRKRLDLIGNDYYLAHIHRSVRWWSNPTHSVVLGDLLGSQWISEEEFERRSNRFWNHVFKRTQRVPDAVTSSTEVAGRLEVLNKTATSIWKNRLIAVAGNHDVGYAGDLDYPKLDRFERVFGPANWAIQFELPSNKTKTGMGMLSMFDKHFPRLRLVVLNSMNLDSPAWNKDLQEQTHDFLKAQISATNDMQSQDATILLTHIPLYKQEGVCSDGPFVDYWPERNGGGISEQNHLTRESSDLILNGLFPAGKSSTGKDTRKRGVVLNGHDHEGCDTVHFYNESAWKTLPPPPVDEWGRKIMFDRSEDIDTSSQTVREITVRSMMGSYSGTAGFLSAWFDEDAGHWQFEYASCFLGVQHVWWAVHIWLTIYLASIFLLIPIGYRDQRVAEALELKNR